MRGRLLLRRRRFSRSNRSPPDSAREIACPLKRRSPAAVRAPIALDEDPGAFLLEPGGVRLRLLFLRVAGRERGRSRLGPLGLRGRNEVRGGDLRAEVAPLRSRRRSWRRLQAFEQYFRFRPILGCSSGVAQTRQRLGVIRSAHVRRFFPRGSLAHFFALGGLAVRACVSVIADPPVRNRLPNLRTACPVPMNRLCRTPADSTGKLRTSSAFEWRTIPFPAGQRPAAP
jgi:hypothetical protein